MSDAPQEASTENERRSDSSKRMSLNPAIPGAFPTASPSEDQSEIFGMADETAKPRKRDFWKMGKKNEEEKTKDKVNTPSTSVPAESFTASRASAAQIAPISARRPVSPLRSQDSLRASASPQRTHPYGMPTSPGQGVYSSSPRLHSPADSQIFERDVQEDVVPSQASPQIPSHIITENHIPPALDASSEAITDRRLDPDTVEIVTHPTHQPASVTITGAPPEQPLGSSIHDDLMHNPRHDTDNASNYGSFDTSDVRRLSFISFADVVHAEQVGHAEEGQRRDSAHLMSLSGHSGMAIPRSPSPMRSPVSSHGLGTSPPTSVSASVRGHEASPSRGPRGPGSPPPGQPSPLGGELNIETMTQALRKTGSGDLSGFRSQPLSAMGNEDSIYQDRPSK